MKLARPSIFVALAFAVGALPAFGQTRHHSETTAAHVVPPPHPTAPAPAAPAAAPATPPPAAAASTPPPVVPDYPRRAVANVSISKQTRVNIAWQIALESVDFSPGIIDGHFKRKSLMALNEFAARYFPGASPFDLRVFDALKVDADDAITTYPITDDDAAQVGGPLPEDWNAKARLERLLYESLADCLSEKFHCTRSLLETLNPGVKLDSLEPGQTINVPNLRPFPTDNKPTVTVRNSATKYVSINLAEKTIRVFDKDDKEIALFHCSVAKDKAKLPAKDTAIKSIAAPNPEYWFDPKNWPEVTTVHQVLIIHPGPRNPVGIAWVTLELPGYGIHGSPKPELIGKTGSHGCFRLTNWDALKFAGLVRERMVVKIMNPERE